MPYIIILKVRKFHQSTRNRFGTAGKKPVGGHNVPPSLNRVNRDSFSSTTVATEEVFNSQTGKFHQDQRHVSCCEVIHCPDH